MTKKTLLSILFSLSVASFGACTQGEGERCQIDDDCEDSLTCNEGTQRCQLPGTVRDASVLIDSAPRPDAPSLPDATLADAAPADASTVDAAPSSE